MNVRTISSLKSIDLALVDSLVDFIRGRGYVLDFSDRSFAAFFATELNVDIDDPTYSQNGGSKGRRLRSFLEQVDDVTAVRVLQALWDRRVQYLLLTGSGDPVANAEGRFLSVIAKLDGRSATPSGWPSLPATPDAGVLADLRANLLRIRDLEAHTRGYAFEGFLRRCFDASGLEAREPFRNTGEQIDGSFQLGYETYLLEAKWIAARVGNRDLHAFHGKLEGKAAWARGLFVSFSGFTKEGLASFGTGKRVICVEGRDLYEALDQRISIRTMLERKVRYAAETGMPFVPVRHLVQP